MATKPPSDAPFGLEPNVAAGLAYILGVIGGIIMLVGGGTNKFVKWAAAQSITIWIVYVVGEIALTILNMILGMVHLWPLMGIVGIVGLILFIGCAVAAVWGAINGFQGKEVKLPFFADLTSKFFGGMVA
jgi:uncharacterized membrane protein